MNKTSREQVAENVRVEMARQRARQGGLATAMRLSQPATSRRLSGEVPFTVDELQAAATFLGVDAAALLNGPEAKVS